MQDLAAELLSELSSKIKFVIPVFGGIPVPDSIFVTWIIMAVLVIASALLTRNLKLMPTGAQAYLETGMDAMDRFFFGILGEKGKCYIPYLITVALYIGIANGSGLFGAAPPTKDLNVTAGLAVTSIFMIEISGIRERGVKGWLHSFQEPMAVILPINILEVFIRPLSLCMRLFGNVLGAFIVMELIKLLAPALVPLPFSLYFDIFDGLIQAYVFVFLTALFIKEAID